MKYIFVFLITLIFISIGSSQETYEVKSQTKGFSIAADLGNSGWTCDQFDFQGENGFGYGFHANYGISHQWVLYLQTHFATIVSDYEGNDDYPFFDAALGGRYYFGTNTIKWRPFVGAHVNYMKLTTTVYDLDTGDPYKMRFKGIAGGLSAGLNFYINSQLSLFGILQANFGRSSSIYFDFDKLTKNYSFSTIQYGLGISYNFLN